MKTSQIFKTWSQAFWIKEVLSLSCLPVIDFWPLVSGEQSPCIVQASRPKTGNTFSLWLRRVALSGAAERALLQNSPGLNVDTPLVTSQKVKIKREGDFHLSCFKIYFIISFKIIFSYIISSFPFLPPNSLIYLFLISFKFMVVVCICGYEYTCTFLIIPAHSVQCYLFVCFQAYPLGLHNQLRAFPCGRSFIPLPVFFSHVQFFVQD